MSLIRNERLKLFATYLNGLAIAILRSAVSRRCFPFSTDRPPMHRLDLWRWWAVFVFPSPERYI
jgi:hypothetical protein